MKVQEFGKPEITFSWLLETDSYSKEHHKKTLDSNVGKQQLADTILLCLDQGKEIRIGTDGMCLILEANEADSEYTDASYQYVDEDHAVYEIKDDSKERSKLASLKTKLENLNFSSVSAEDLKAYILKLIDKEAE